MSIDLPGCPLKSCRYQNDGNCTDNKCYEDCILRNMVQIPDNATNGDVIKAVFPNIEWTGNCQDVDFYMLDGDTPYSAKMNTFRSWWNAPYKREGDAE